MRRVTCWVAALSLCFVVAGCEEADPTSSAYWIAKLKTPEQSAAIQKLGEMKAKDAIKPLQEAYKTGRKQNKYRVIVALQKIGDKSAIPTMLEALQDNSAPKAGQLAGNILLEWEAKEHIDIYLNVASNKSAPNEPRMGAFQLLAEYPEPKIEQTMLSTLNADPDMQPIVFMGLAAEALGKLKSVKAVPGLIRCLWLDDHRKQNEVAACRMALNRIGPKAAVPALIEALERKNRVVEDRARKLKYNVGGLIEAKTAEILGDMPHPDAVEPLIAAMQKQEEMPVSVQNDPKKAQFFVMSKVQKVISTAGALAAIGDERAVDALLSAAADGQNPLEYKLAATQQLAFLGIPRAIVGDKKTPGLLDLANKEISQHDPVSQGFRVQLALAIGNLLDGSDEKLVDTAEKAIQGYKDELAKYTAETNAAIEKDGKKDDSRARDLKAYAQWTKDYDEALAKIAAVRECKDDVGCWEKKLAGKVVAERLVAGYRLTNSKNKSAALKVLGKFVADKDDTVRNVVLFGIARQGDPSVMPVVEAARAANAAAFKENPKDRNLKAGLYAYDLLLAHLTHKK